MFWRGDHFGEYVHPERGLVDTHGLSDVNWAAVVFGLVNGRRLKQLWARLMNEPAFWAGDMPTQAVTKHFAYEKWEISPEPGCSVDPLTVRSVKLMLRQLHHLPRLDPIRPWTTACSSGVAES